MQLLDRIEKNLELRNDNGLLRQLKTTKGLIDFCSNDYLGLSTDTQLQLNIKSKLESIGFDLGSGGSRLLAGNSKTHELFETTLANVHKAEAALLFNSGYVANLGFFSTVPSKGDVVLYDEKIHACIKDGMRLSLAKHHSFKHNDVAHLEKKLSTLDVDNVFIAIESVYSMDGDECPLLDIIALAKKYNAFIVLDEAHTTGVNGVKGGGLAVELGVEKDVFARIHTFGKGIGSHGACIIGSESLKVFLINNARSFIYTTALPEHHVHVLMEVYDYVGGNYTGIHEELQNKIQLFKDNVKGTFVSSSSPIQALIIPGNEEVCSVASALQSQGFDVRPVMSPTVADGEERIRICLHRHNSDSDILALCSAINKIV